MAKGNHLNAGSLGTAAVPEDSLGSERSAEDIRHDIEARRESITETVDRLSDRFQETFDWRTYVARYPLVAVGLAAGLGLLVSGIFKPRPSPAERIQEAFADGFEDFADRVRSQFHGVIQKPGMTQTVKAAATGYLVKAATEYLKDRFLNNQEGQSLENDRAPKTKRAADYSIPRTEPFN